MFTNKTSLFEGTIILNEQEAEGTLSFYGNHNVMTRNFVDTFGDEASSIVFIACALVMEAHPDGTDYLQTFTYRDEYGKETKFWLMIDVPEDSSLNILTALLPKDY